MEDSIAVEERVQVDYSAISHQIVEFCGQFNNNVWNDQEDVDIFVSDLFENKFHLAKEYDVLVFGFIAEDATCLFNVRISESFKKDYYLEESIETENFLVQHVLMDY